MAGCRIQLATFYRFIWKCFQFYYFYSLSFYVFFSLYYYYFHAFFWVLSCTAFLFFFAHFRSGAFIFFLLPFFHLHSKLMVISLFYFHLHSIVPELFSWVDCYHFCVAENWSFQLLSAHNNAISRYVYNVYTYTHFTLGFGIHSLCNSQAS